MTERALSEDAMRASLQDIGLPAQAAGGLIADIAITMGLAAAAALIVAGGLRLFSRRLRPVGPPSLADRLSRAQGLPENRQRLVLLHLLRQHAPERYAELARDLYRPQAGVTTQALQAELEHLV